MNTDNAPMPEVLRQIKAEEDADRKSRGLVRVIVNGSRVTAPARGATALELMAAAGLGDAGSRELIRYQKDGTFGIRYWADHPVPLEDGDEFVASPTGHF